VDRPRSAFDASTAMMYLFHELQSTSTDALILTRVYKEQNENEQEVFVTRASQVFGHVVVLEACTFR